MLHMHELQAQNLHGLSPEALVEMAERMRLHIEQQAAQLDEHRELLDKRERQVAEQAQAIKFKDAKIERITFELARLKPWKFGAKTERMSAEQIESPSVTPMPLRTLA